MEYPFSKEMYLLPFPSDVLKKICQLECLSQQNTPIDTEASAKSSISQIRKCLTVYEKLLRNEEDI